MLELAFTKYKKMICNQKPYFFWFIYIYNLCTLIFSYSKVIIYISNLQNVTVQSVYVYIYLLSIPNLESLNLMD